MTSRLSTDWRISIVLRFLRITGRGGTAALLAEVLRVAEIHAGEAQCSPLGKFFKVPQTFLDEMGRYLPRDLGRLPKEMLLWGRND